MPSKRRIASKTRRVQRKRAWATFTVAERARVLHALPQTLPIPASEKGRMRSGAIGMGEFSKWIHRFLEETPDAEDGAALRVVADRLKLYYEAVQALNEGEHQGARTLLERIVEESPEDRMAALNLALAEIETGDAEKALSRFDELEPHFAGESRVPVLRSRALLRLERRDEALKLLWEAHEANREDRSVVSELQRLGEFVPVQFVPGAPSQTRLMPRAEYEEAVFQRSQQMVEAKDVERLLVLIDRMIVGGRGALAVRIAESAVQAIEENTRLHRTLAFALCAADRAEDAVKAGEKAVELAPESSRSHAALARALRQAGRLDESREAFRKAIELDGTNVDAFEQYLISFEEAERLAKAKELEADFPSSWIPGKLIGDLLFAAGDVEAALECHYKALKAGNSDDALTMVLHDLGHLGRIEEAVREVEKQGRDIARRGGNARWNAANLMLEGGRARGAAEILHGMVVDEKLAPELRFSANRLLAQAAPRKR